MSLLQEVGKCDHLLYHAHGVYSVVYTNVAHPYQHHHKPSKKASNSYMVNNTEGLLGVKCIPSRKI